MKEILISLIIFLLVNIIWYITFAFVLFEKNVGMWSESARFILVWFSFMTSIVFIIIYLKPRL